MKINKLLTLFAVFLLLGSTFTMMCRPYAAARELSAQGTEATLTGSILDRGVDANGNGLYDYLEVDVEINVTIAGTFRVDVSGLMDEYSNYIPTYSSSQGFLDTGNQYLNVSISDTAIVSSGFDPQEVNLIQLYSSNGSIYEFQDAVHNVVLSRMYNHTEFDRHAFLTGHISDQGFDTDGDGLFNYLEVGVEFNVTHAGQYQISVEGLAERTVYTTNYFYDYHYEQENFATGIHTFYMNFSGPGIVYNHLNPTDVNVISVYDVTDGVQTSWLSFAHLSMQYSHTLFDAPSENIEVNFKVYPDATVAVDGTANSTHMYPENSGLQTNVTVGFSTTGNVTTETSNGTIVFPDSTLNQNAIEAHLRSTYMNGLENDTVNASLVLSPEEAGNYPFNATDVNLDAVYLGGLFDVNVSGQTIVPDAFNTVFPFNMSDATVRADFDGTGLEGNITFHGIGGFPFADVIVYFSGNRSSLHFTGDVNVTYASYDGFEINETMLDQTLSDMTANFTGQGPDSLYDLTGGFLECTSLSVIKTPWSNPTLGADVTYDATVIGNFSGAIARMIFPPGSPDEGLQQFAYASLESTTSSVRNASVVVNYYHGSRIATVNLHMTSDVHVLLENLLALAPPVTPTSFSLNETQVAAWIRIANATSSAIIDGSLGVSYSSAERKMTLNAWLLTNASQLKNDVVPILADAARADMHDIFESYLNTTYCTISSSITTLDMVNETATFSSNVTIQGDFEAGLNHAKGFLIAVMYPPSTTIPVFTSSARSMTSLPWDIRMLNETEINIDNFQAELELGRDWMHTSFSGLILKPQPDNIDSITFKLKSWLLLAADTNAPPLEFEKLSITFSGASSANQTVLLSKPPNIPAPDQSSTDGKTMSWNNASLSSLKDLMFLTAFQQQINYGGATYDIPVLTNSTVKDFVFDANARKITFNVTGPPGTGFCNVTIPKNVLNASLLSDWIVTFDGRTLAQEEFNITQNADYVFLYLNYTHSEHVITISVPPVISEFQPNLLPIVVAIPVIIAVIAAVKQRRKLEPLKTRCRQVLAHAKLALKTS